MGYEEALNLAVDAAREAAELLREEFHRPGGPRGEKGSCPADVEAERLLRDRLTSATGWAFLGEETGSSSAGEHLWIVDPNDGTTPFQRGMRGSAISIALLRDDEPVLGVVYSFVHPDDRGDLIAWAEGCGPVRRNGRPIEPERFASLDGAVVLVSHAADEAPGANATCVAPARYIALPSLAYRLALVAVGDAAAAVSLHGPKSWDFAAGHALLRGAGKALLDGDGAPITYRNGRASVGSCFGGDAPICTELAKRSWEPVFERKPGQRRARPSIAGRAIRDPVRLARAQGTLLGQLAGDALGSLVEFQSAEQIARRNPEGVRELVDGGTWNTLAGQPTDDSEMALMLARSLVEQGRFHEPAVAAAYVRWYESKPFDIGNTTRNAVAALRRGERAESESQANGSLMRVSPIGIFAAGRPSDAAELARRDSALTHPHTVCQEACAAFTAAIATGIGGADAEAMWRAALDHGAHPAVRETLEAARQGTPRDFSTQMGWVLIALQNAFHELLHAPTLEEGVVRTVMRGGDTDTNAAIAGALLGALHGREGIPHRWIRALLSCRPIPETGARHPRPQALWPVDALQLAERLLVAGAV